MIGIDIVDLQDPLLRARNNALRFITHPGDIFSENELSYWLLWAAKEAIFKTRRELKPFYPKMIRTEIHESNDRIFFTSGDITGEILLSPDQVIALAKKNVNAISFHAHKTDSKCPSVEIRSLISAHFLKIKSQHIKVIEDSNGLPMLDYGNIPVSIAHHHRSLAFAYPDF